MCSIDEGCLFLADNGALLGLGFCVDDECRCPSSLGFMGETCSETSPHIIISFIFELLSSLFGVVLMFYGFFLLYKASSLKLSSVYVLTEDMSVTLLTVGFITMFAILAIICDIIINIMLLRSLVQPDKVDFVFQNDEIVAIVPKPAQLYLTFQSISVICGLLGILTVVLSWLSLLEELSPFITTSAYTSLLSNSKRAVKYLFLIASICVVFLFISSFGVLQIAGTILGFLILLLFIMLAFGWKYLVKVLDLFNTETTKKTVALISTYAFRFSISLAFIVFALALRTILSIPTAVLDEGQKIDPVILILKLVVQYIILYLVYLLLSYSARITQNLFEKCKTNLENTELRNSVTVHEVSV